MPPLGGAGDHRVGGGAGPPTTFSSEIYPPERLPPGCSLGSPPPPTPNLHPPGLLPPGSSLGLPPHPIPTSTPRGSCPPGPLRGAPSPNPHPWEGDDRGDVKPLGGAAHHGSPPPSGHRSVVKSSPSAGWLHCGPVGPGRCGRGGGGLWFRRNHGSPFPPLRCRAALTWRRGLAPLCKVAVAFLCEGVTRSPAISKTWIASSRNPRYINCSAPKDLPMW